MLGGTGFVGRNLRDVLRGKGISHGVASRSTGTDLRDPLQCERLLAKELPDVVVNCAAHVGSLNYVTEQAAVVIADNCRMTLGMYEAIAIQAPAALVINLIANCAYPNTDETFVESGLWDGPLHRSVLPYGATRRLLLAAADCFSMQHGVRSISLLVPNMYGPYDATDPNKAHALNALVAKFVKAQAVGLPEVEVWGTGVAIREWLNARDCGRAICEVIENPARVGLDEPINIGQDFGLSVRELVTIIRDAVGYKGKIRFDASRPDGAPRKVMDDRRFRKVFPAFKFTDFESGILETVKFYQSVLPY